jgi:hypothetical protein
MLPCSGSSNVGEARDRSEFGKCCLSKGHEGFSIPMIYLKYRYVLYLLSSLLNFIEWERLIYHFIALEPFRLIMPPNPSTNDDNPMNLFLEFDQFFPS